MIKYILIGLASVVLLSVAVVAMHPGERVCCRMDWERPMQGTGTVEFGFKPEGEQTGVTWSMYGQQGFLAKAVSLFMDCDAMCGPQVERGLADLGTLVAATGSTP